MTPRRLGDYAIEGELGSGGMGVVYLARDPQGAQVALKSIAGALDPDLLGRFKREAKVLARLDHPGVCAMRELVEEGPGAPFLVLDYVPGRTLGDLAREGLEVSRAAALVAQVCDAVEHAHRAGVLHRDLKPSNVIVTPDDRAVVLDFGLARRAGDAESQALSRTGDVLGTPAFMAPEQALGGTVDARSDVYGIGATLYAALTGEPPFRGTSALQIMTNVIEQEPMPPSRIRADLPPALEAVCLRALAKQPERRFPSAAALGEALLAPAPRPGRARRWPWAVAAVGVALMCGVGLGLRAPATETATPSAPAPPPPTSPTPTPRPTAPADVDGPIRPDALFQERLGRAQAFAQEQTQRPFPRSNEQLARDALSYRGWAAELLRWADRDRETAPRNPKAWVRSAIVRLLTERSEEAVACADRALALQADYGPGLMIRARALARRWLWDRKHPWLGAVEVDRRAREVLVALAKVARRRPLLPYDRAWVKVLKALHGRGNRPSAADVHAALTGIDGPGPRLLRVLTVSILERDEPRAQRLLIEAVRAFPSSVVVRRFLGQLSYDRQPKALRDLAFVLAHRPTEIDLWLRFNGLVQQRNITDAKALLKAPPAALARSPVLAVLRAQDALLDAKQPRRALSILSELDPQQLPKRLRHVPQVTLAEAELQVGNLDRAAELVRALDRPGTRRHVEYTGARCFLALSDLPTALRFARGLAMRRPSANALLTLGQVMLSAKQVDQAVEAFQRARRRSQNDPWFTLWHGVGLVRAAKPEAARRVLNDLKPGSMHALTLEARLLLAQEFAAPAAIPKLTRAIELATPPHSYLALLTRALLHANKKSYAAAAADGAESLKACPYQPDARNVAQLVERWRAQVR